MRRVPGWSAVLLLLVTPLVANTIAEQTSHPERAAAVAPASPGVDVVVNGSFETPAVPGSLLAFGTGQTFGGWTVASGNVDLVRTIWTAADGTQSLDLSGSVAGAIYQDLPTVPGQQYSLSFEMAGNYAGAPVVKSMEVFWGATSLGVFTFDVTGRSASNMGWTPHTVPSLVATGTTTRLKFVGLVSTWYGPVLDAVQVVDEGTDLVSLRLAKTLVAGCLKTSGKVTLAEPAPAAGLVVSLASSNPKVVVPASITLKAGTISKSFQIATTPVSAREDATISASTPGTTLSATLTLRPIGTKKVTLTPLSVVGGANVAGLVTLECPANPADITVTMWSTKPGAAVPDVTELVVPQGVASADFAVMTVPVAVVTKASIKARANDITKAKVLVVTPPAP